MNNSDERSTHTTLAVPPTGVVPLGPTDASNATEASQGRDSEADLQRHLHDLDNLDVLAEPTPRPRRAKSHRRPNHLTSRRVIPSGKVSLEGDRAWPQPSKTARRLTWGAVGIAALATTAGTFLAVRKVVDLMSDDRPDRDTDRDRAAPRHTATAHHFTDTPPAPKPSKPSKPKRSFVAQVNETAQSLERIATIVAQTVATVRGVGDQAEELIGGVKRTADHLRTTLDPDAVGPVSPGPRPSHVPDLDTNPRRDDPTIV